LSRAATWGSQSQETALEKKTRLQLERVRAKEADKAVQVAQKKAVALQEKAAGQIVAMRALLSKDRMDLIVAPVKLPIQQAVDTLEAAVKACETIMSATTPSELCELPEIASVIASGKKAMALVTSMLAAVRRY
jgi:hypothetical protein